MFAPHERKPIDLSGKIIRLYKEPLEKVEFQLANEWAAGKEGAYVGFGHETPRLAEFRSFTKLPETCYSYRSEGLFCLNYENLGKFLKLVEEKRFKLVLFGHLDLKDPNVLEREIKPLEDTRADVFAISVQGRNERTVFGIRDSKVRNLNYEIATC